MMTSTFQAWSQPGQELIIGPGISLDKDSHDFGQVEHAQEAKCTFTVTNVGTDALIISDCKTSCGCTVPTFSKKPMMPGESTEITVSYDTKRMGDFNKSIRIISNASNQGEYTVYIKGEIIRPANYPPLDK